MPRLYHWCVSTRKPETYSTLDTAESSVPKTETGIHYICWLNEYIGIAYIIVVFRVFAVAMLSFINDQKDNLSSFSQQMFIAFIHLFLNRVFPLGAHVLQLKSTLLNTTESWVDPTQWLFFYIKIPLLKASLYLQSPNLLFFASFAEIYWSN